jgi:hypothetical protein
LCGEKTSLDHGGKLHLDYLKNCRALLAYGKLVSMWDDEAVTYMKLLWEVMKKDQSYVSWLALKGSNMYQVMQDRFMSELYIKRHEHVGCWW